MLELRTPETRVDAVLLDAAEAVPSDGSAGGGSIWCAPAGALPRYVPDSGLTPGATLWQPLRGYGRDGGLADGPNYEGGGGLFGEPKMSDSRSVPGLVISSGRMYVDPTLPEAGSLQVIVYPRAAMVRSKRAAQEPLRRLKFDLHEGEDWPLREILEQLLASHGVRRVAVAVRPRLFRALTVAGLVDELSIAWRPVIAGDSLPPITGRDREFLPRGIVLDLLKVERKEMEYVARYRVRDAR